MKHQDYVDNLPIGGVVRNGHILATMYRKGLIPEYDSTYKYITGDHFFGSVEYLGNFFRLKYFDGCFCPFLVKDMPPMKWTKDGRRIPTKRIYYRSFKGSFSRTTYGDDLNRRKWNLHYKFKFNLNGMVWEYACKSLAEKHTMRVPKQSFESFYK